MIGAIDARASAKKVQIVESLWVAGGKALASTVATDVCLSVRLTCVGLNELFDLGVVQFTCLRRPGLRTRPAWRLQDWVMQALDNGRSYEQVLAQGKARRMDGVTISSGCKQEQSA